MSARAALLVSAVFALAGCERAMHDMYDQPKYKPLAASRLFPDGRAARVPPDGTVVRTKGDLADVSSGRLGGIDDVPAPSGAAVPLGDDGRPLSATGPDMDNPLPVTMALLERGRERYDIYCAPCHGRAGDGHGRVAERGFPAPPSYHEDRLRKASDAHFYRVIRDGYGIMFPYAGRVAPRDRWAIVAYIRALQLAQHATRDALTPADIARLDGAHANRADAFSAKESRR